MVEEAGESARPEREVPGRLAPDPLTTAIFSKKLKIVQL
jgi:hypothetical protein